MSTLRDGRVPDGDREAVRRALEVRYRPDDGHSGGATLREMIESGRFAAKTKRTVSGCSQAGLLMVWPGLNDLQFFAVPDPLWEAVDLPASEG